jgi:hypothetical protein
MESTGKILMIFGIILFALGLALTFSSKLPFRFLQLPGDISIQTKNVQFVAPLTSMILVSAVLSGVLWLASRFSR